MGQILTRVWSDPERIKHFGQQSIAEPVFLKSKLNPNFSEGYRHTVLMYCE